MITDSSYVKFSTSAVVNYCIPSFLDQTSWKNISIWSHLSSAMYMRWDVVQKV